MFSQAKPFWPLLDQLGKSAPFTKEGVEAQLGIPLVATSQNDYFMFYEGGPVKLDNGLSISKVDLRIKREGGHAGLLVLSLAGSCVTLAAVREHFPNLTLTDVPRGRSANESTSLESSAGWGTLGFSFPVNKPDCVGTVALKPALR